MSTMDRLSFRLLQKEWHTNKQYIRLILFNIHTLLKIELV